MLFSFFCKKKRINIKYYSNQPFSMSDFPAIFLPRDSQGQYPVLSHNPNPNWELCT